MIEGHNKQLVPGLVSVVMPMFNSAAYLGASINSVLRQTYVDWELLIVDDCSKDSSADIANAFMDQDGRIQVSCNKTNSGAAVSRNYALETSRGQYVAFLDADDTWEAIKLEIQIEHMQRTGAIFSFTPYKVIDSDGEFTGRIVDLKTPNRVSYLGMLKKSATIGCSTVIIDQSKTGRLVMPLLRTGQDYGLWLKILRTIPYAEKVPKVLSAYRITPGSISRNKYRKAKRQWSIYTEVEGIGTARAAWYFAHYAWRAIFRG